jgi:hypothetical protein
LAQALVTAGAVLNDQRKSTRVFVSSSERHKKILASCRERNTTFREMPGICEQAVSLNAPRGRVHRSVLSIP